MSIVVNIYYIGENGNARKFAKEMTESGLVERIRSEEGNIRYEYYYPAENDQTVLLIDEWKNQESLDFHHKTEMMQQISDLRKKYHLRMKVEKFIKE